MARRVMALGVTESLDGALLWAVLARSLVRAAAAMARRVMTLGITKSLDGALLWAALARSFGACGGGDGTPRDGFGHH